MKSLQTRMAAQGHQVGARRPNRTGGKISEKLIDLFQDEVNGDTDLQAAKGLIMLAAIAWNLAVEPEVGVGEQMRRTLLGVLPPEAQTAAQAHIEQMKQRKLSLFPKDRRLVMQTDAHLQNDGESDFTAAAAGYEDGSGRAYKSRSDPLSAPIGTAAVTRTHTLQVSSRQTGTRGVAPPPALSADRIPAEQSRVRLGKAHRPQAGRAAKPASPGRRHAQIRPVK